MKSFPSTINESQLMYGSSKANAYNRTFDIERLISGALNLNKSVPVIVEQLKENNINAGNFQAYQPMSKMTNPAELAVVEYSDYADDGVIDENKELSTTEKVIQKNPALIEAMKNAAQNANQKKQEEKVYFENPLQLPTEIIALAKDYDWAYRYMVKEIADKGEYRQGKKDGDKGSVKVAMTHTSIAPSMFNHMYGVSVLGIIRNTPLLNDVDDKAINPKISDCSIRMLCALSKMPNSELGQARYKYSDFMYCKDLGKVSNNHLITLRKFSHAVTDHIFEMSSPKMIQDEYSFETVGDVGRLITWFGTDDNKLEDIIKFSYHATWKNLDAKIEEQESKADDESSGIIGMLSNSFNPAYNRAVNAGVAGKHNIWGWLGSKLTSKVYQGIGKNNVLLTNYDNNKVYTPKNTIQSTHIYEGKLEFTHQFTLNFSYKLRAYENINPRSAFLDLIGNILEVTYKRGKFWGGSRKLIGPPQNQAPFRAVSNMIDGSWDKMANLFSGLGNGNFNWKNFLGSLASTLGEMGQSIANMAKNTLNSIVGGATGGGGGQGGNGQGGNGQGGQDGGGEGGGDSTGEGGGVVSTVMGHLQSFISAAMKGGIGNNIKGQMKNAFGRPTAIAWQSLLSGAPVGLWHVTIGNPRNPIMAIGNLILEDASIVQSGPLGLDDFPTELRVSVTLKHAMPRDITDIGRMYTKGAAGIYHILSNHELKDFFGSAPIKGAVTMEESERTLAEADYDSEYKKANGGDATQSDGETAPVESTAKEGSEDRFKKELKAAQGEGTGVIGAVSLNDLLLPNPFIENDTHAGIIRKNNYSDEMLRTAIDECA